MKLCKFIAIASVVILSLTSCWRETSPADGLDRYRSKSFRYNIDYPADSCNVSVSNQTSHHVLTITDNDNNYRIQVLALKSELDKRFKFNYYPTVDTLFYKNGVLQSETKDFFTDRIKRTYSVNKYITMETLSIFGGERIYVLYSEFNESGKAAVSKIKESFKSSSGIGPVNFCKRKIYSLIGDNFFSTLLSYVIFSLLFTFLFWSGLFLCFQLNNHVAIILSAIGFIIVFALFAVTDDFMGYLYGHNNLFYLIAGLMLMFCDEG